MTATHLAILLTALAAEPARASDDGVHLSGCIVSLQDEVLVPAPHAGVLMSLSIREGSRLLAGQAIAQIDDAQQRLELELARNEREAAAEKAADDTNVRHAEAARLVSEAELHGAVAVNKKVAGTHSANEIRRLTLAARKMALLVERSQADQRVTHIELRGREVALALAQQNVQRCAVDAPLSGEVIEVLKGPGEWVNPGEPIVHIVRLDKLRVEGFVNASEHSPASIDARPVRVTVAAEQGRRHEFAGRIVYVRPTVQAGEQYLVYAEVDNRSEDGHWLLRPGMIAAMQIDTSARRVSPPPARTADVDR
jgi:macrolide-specific efflux system membrane fusion protein